MKNWLVSKRCKEQAHLFVPLRSTMSDRRRRNVSDLGPPPRWLNCPRKGDLVAEKFLPFKTPLSGVYDSQVPEANRFYPSMLLASLARYKVKLGLWIDLTNTGRFYDRKEVEECGVKYLKLQCRGCVPTGGDAIATPKCMPRYLSLHGAQTGGAIIAPELWEIECRRDRL
ncbi:mRNA-capping enzyme isoform X2 [Ixodes scapularis]